MSPTPSIFPSSAAPRTDKGHRCNTTLTAADYVGLQRPTGDSPFPTHTGKFHAFTCLDCGDTHDSGTLICHNCHPDAAHRQGQHADPHAGL